MNADNIKHFLRALLLSFVVSISYFLIYHDSGMKEAVFGFFYFLITPFLAMPYLPISMVVMIILLLLFRRVSTCMRENFRWLAYTLLWLHWVAFGIYCASYVVV